MPIRPENRDRYPADWKLRSRFVREYRAKGKCEWCKIRNYAVGQRIDGVFHPIRGNIYLDRMQYAHSYEEARELADYSNERNDEPHRYIVIVLTVAHVYDDRPENAALLNLAALCQRCHNLHDAKARQHGRQERLRIMSPQQDLFRKTDTP